jgi:hypothetical protein
MLICWPSSSITRISRPNAFVCADKGLSIQPPSTGNEIGKKYSMATLCRLDRLRLCPPSAERGTNEKATAVCRGLCPLSVITVRMRGAF